MDADGRWRILRLHVEDQVPLAALARHHGLGVRTLERWHARYRAGGLSALGRVPRADAGGHHLPADLIALIEGLGLTRPRPPIAAIHRTVVKVCAGTAWPVPSYGVVRSIITALDPGMVTLALSGIGPTRITTVLGILKAYTTRVGSGPFPTELFDQYGQYLAKTGGEVGVTTGRPRRCGWFDAVIARYATRVNGITDYFLTKLDVLSSLETVPICVGYSIDGKRTDEMPMPQSDIARAEPIYEEMPGWWEDISGAREFDDLPAKARDYVLRLEELAGAHVSCIGVGPGRDQTIVRRDILAS